MKKLFLVLMALLAVFCFTSGAYCADGDELSTTSFRIDSNGEMYYQALNEVVSTNDTVTASESGKVFLMSGSSGDEIVMALPAADEGLVYTFVSINADSQKFEINPNGTDQLVFSTAAAGNRIVSAGNISDSVTVYASDDTVWAVIPHVGTFTVKND